MGSLLFDVAHVILSKCSCSHLAPHGCWLTQRLVIVLANQKFRWLEWLNV